MGDKTGIEWTDATWNPTRGCRRVSPGCENCYAERQAIRGVGGPYKGLVVAGKNGPRWTGEGKLVKEALALPLRWTKPRRIFVDSMSDLFFEGFDLPDIAAVFGVMAAAPQHTFQILTKRPERMREWFAWIVPNAADALYGRANDALEDAGFPIWERHRLLGWWHNDPPFVWPLPNVHLGVSVETQYFADDRIPELLATPAVSRFVSYEPALERVDFRSPPIYEAEERTRNDLDWIIVGGESGPGARPFDVQWARSTIEQCKEADIACFVKQLGANVFNSGGSTFPLKDKKGGDWNEWPESLRVREFPKVPS